MVFDKTTKPGRDLRSNPPSAETLTHGERALLKAGEGQVAYFRPVEVPAESGDNAIDAIGVFSATGELIAVTEDLAAAVGFSMENELKLVARH